MKNCMPIADRIPGLIVGVVALIVASALAEIGFILGWILSLLEVHSIFNRIAPSWTATSYFIGACVTLIAIKVLLKVGHKITGIPE